MPPVLLAGAGAVVLAGATYALPITTPRPAAAVAGLAAVYGILLYLPKMRHSHSLLPFIFVPKPLWLSAV